jgi:hypothetical protein
MSILSSSYETPDDWNLSHCLFSNFLQALSSLCYDTATGQVLASSILTKNEPFPYRYVIEEIVRNCRNQTIIKMLDSVVRPLILILNREVSSLSREDAALSLLYVGLLRFHILLPTSNTDPGRKPALKAIQLDEYIGLITQSGFLHVQIQKQKPIFLPDQILEAYLDAAGIEQFRNSGTGIVSVTVFGKKPEKASCCAPNSGCC